MKKYTFFAAAALMLAACSSEEVTTVPDGEVALQVNAAISGTATRASGTAWAEDDRIGISTAGDATQTSYANMPYTWDGSSFASDGADIYFRDATETVTFSAYYPFSGTAGTAAGSISASTDADNQTTENQPTIDFLYATGATASKENPTVYFTDDHAFSHRMTRITIEFKEGSSVDFDGGMLTGYTLGGMVMKGSFDTATGEATADATATATPLTITPGNVTTTSGAYTTSVIVFPQEDVTDIPLSVTVDGRTYSATLTVPDHNSVTGLQAGCDYRFPVTVSKTGLTVGTAGINDWTTVADDENTATM